MVTEERSEIVFRRGASGGAYFSSGSPVCPCLKNALFSSMFAIAKIQPEMRGWGSWSDSGLFEYDVALIHQCTHTDTHLTWAQS